MIPLIGNSVPINTIDSIAKQSFYLCEIIILQNNVSTVSNEPGFKEVQFTISNCFVPVRKIQIRKRGKGNALNIGVHFSKYDFICVLDADCVLKKNAFCEAMIHFNDENVSAIGGKIEVLNKKKNILTLCQKVEYMNSFNVWRALFNCMDANFIISGAYGIFRKSDILNVKGYDPDTVGEDMDIVLSMQEYLRRYGKKVIYERKSICYTETPYKMTRLLHQRDRWQRGLLDCLIKHDKLILNPSYGLLGCVAIPFQILFELIEPILKLLYLLNLIFPLIGFESFRIFKIPLSFSIFYIYLGFELSLTFFSEYLEYRRFCVFIFKLPEAIVATVLGMLLSIPLSIARVWGMISFHWRRLVW